MVENVYQREKRKNNGGETKHKNSNWYIYRTYPMLFLLLMCCVIVATCVDNVNVTIIMRDEQQWNKRLVDIKQNKSMEEKLNVKMQSMYRMYLPYAVVAAVVFCYCWYLCI